MSDLTKSANGKEIVIMEGIYKAFPGVQALENVDFTLRTGEIHALVGENGAGKSTLIKVMTGVEEQDRGTVFLEGNEVFIKSPLHAQTMGISTVYQEVNLCDYLTVAENIMLGREPRKFGRIDWKEMYIHADKVLKDLDIDIDVTQPLSAYSTAIQQVTAIARALEISSAKVMILDEPTSSLDAHETEQIFRVMRTLKNAGVGIIFITHFIDQVYEVSDRITVLRNGRRVGTFDTPTMPRMELIAKMIGRSLADYEDMTAIKLETSKNIQKEALLTTDDLALTGSIEPFDLEMHAGEVVGLAGLLGSGRTEMAKLLFGIDQPDNGVMTMEGEIVEDHSPLASIERGVALCPEDRKAEGIAEDLTVRENIILALQAHQGWFKFIPLQKQYEIAEKYINLLNIATPSTEQPVKNLSGGNQQKVILARWLATNPQLLILDEPTRGIDVGAKAEIQKLVLLLAEEGKSCLFISSELEEVLRTCHRVVVLREKKKVSEFTGEVSEREIMQSIGGSE
jgi:simple sugar transport system ATP-binding protein